MAGMTTSPQLRESPATANFHDVWPNAGSESRSRRTNLRMGGHRTTSGGGFGVRRPQLPLWEGRALERRKEGPPPSQSGNWRRRTPKPPPSFAPWIDCLAKAVADDVERRDGEEDGHAGEESQPPGVFDVLLGDGEDAAPGGRRERDAEAEEG